MKQSAKIVKYAAFLRRLASSQKGSSLVIFAIAFTMFAACAALTIDIGATVLEKSRLSTAVDSAALAGLQELLTGSGDTNIVVENYLKKNIDQIQSFTVKLDEGDKRVEVTATKKTKNFFASFIGKNLNEINALAVAKAENIKSLSGIRPLAVIQQTFEYAKQYVLKEGAGDGYSGNYAAISLGGTGNSVYRENMLNGYPGTISVGDMIETETGNMANSTVTSITHLLNSCTHTPLCTYHTYNTNCSRIISIPVVNTLNVSGRKYVKVLGFATFFLEGVANSGGHAEVIGRFITYNAQGETSSEINDYGTYGIRLIK